MSNPLTPLWHASPTEPLPLPPAWRLLLLNDGFTTRNLQIICNSPITATVLGRDPSLVAPPSAQKLSAPLIQRQVVLHNAAQEPLMVGISWWNQSQAKHYLDERPLGTRLREDQQELFRELQAVYLGTSERIANLLGQPGPFWGRHYMLWANQKPLTLIYEVFSPRLEHYLGAAQLSDSKL